ncbi:MAG: 23S rRNA (adenine(2503)-C(2))-methyltransferase RlmN [Clostridiales bacterium]|jgi:23S rRNA (adenine2503-C2)-methyltransferase|nr:23S rRNA (adenine(2503)-C(2))-methyltransferase RlmN [Clostridiales bacterium]
MKKIMLDYTLVEIRGLLADLPAFRSKQLYKWLNLDAEYSTMSNIALDLRAKLADEYIARPAQIVDVLTAKDGTRKYLFRLSDGNIVEGVSMVYEHGTTLCLSTQVGCRMGCAFCASGRDGLVRNMSSGEMLGEVIAVNKYLGGTCDGRAVTNLVLMGMGEPLDNYDHVLKFIRTVSAPESLNIGQRNISLSTCGLVPEILRLAEEGLGVNLTISLHATTDVTRRKNMPVAKTYSIDRLISAAKYYFDKTGRRVIYEYVLLKGENMSPADAANLARITRGYPSHVNLIMLNASGALKNTACTPAEARAFFCALAEAGVSVTIRRSVGAEIEGACGQLRRKFVGDLTAT